MVLVQSSGKMEPLSREMGRLQMEQVCVSAEVGTGVVEQGSGTQF